MHLITRSCVLFLWMHTLTFVKSQDCTRESFLNGPLYDSNFDTSDLEASYPGGKQIRVSCSVGYSGFFRLLCVEGKWQSRGSKCQPRSCGHPGDAQFADFQLEKGEDFVFGSKVVYTCHKGYQMVSRTNYRRCMAEGWDGVIPVCEAQQCPVIHVDNNVQVNGDPEEATYGNVVRFSCKSNTEILSGPTEIYCDENGDWSDAAPKCKAIQCEAPTIENGDVLGNIQAYKEHDVLHFRCNAKYKPAENRPSKCTKLGTRAEWSPTPVCEPVKCKLEYATQGTTYDPPYRNVFSPGDTVRVICGEKYFISNHRVTSAVATCNDDGEWDERPICHEVICSNPRDILVSQWYDNWRQQIKLDETVSYKCRSGYKNTGGAKRATCTREGWRPNPLCQEKTCDRLDIPNANIVNANKQIYKINEVAKYVCWEGYRGSPTRTCGENGWKENSQCTAITCDRKRYSFADIERNVKTKYRYNDQVEYICKDGYKGRFTLTCLVNGWTGSPQCEKCEKANVQHGFVLGPYNDTVYYSCNEGYKLFTKGWWGEATCIDGVWSGLQRCIEKGNCGEIPVIPNSEVTPQLNDYEDGKRIQIICKEGYQAQDGLTCRNGTWRSNGPLETICTPSASHCNPPPKVENAVVMTSYQKNFLPNSAVTYKCHVKYTMEGEDTIRCKDGKWEKKNIYCTHKTCKVGVMHPHLNVTGLPLANETMKIGHKLQFKCDDQYLLDGSEEIECLQTGQWNADFPTCAAPLGCSRPPPLANGDTNKSSRLKYSHNERFEYTCLNDYIMEGKPYKTCINGKWIGDVKCLLCSTLPDVPHAHVSEETKKAVYPQGHVIHFTCETGYVSGRTIRYICTNTGWVATYQGKCYLKPCELPDDTPNGYYQIINGEDFVFGATIKYFCNEGYQMVSKEDTRTCLLDKWTNHVPTCDPLSCDPPPTDSGVTVKGLPQNEEPILPDRFLTFSCDGPGKYLDGSSVLICGKDGQWDNPFPSCKDITCKVGVMHPHLYVYGLPPANGTMKIGHELQFQCSDQYALDGFKEVKCLETGQWNAPFPNCTDKCKVTDEPASVRIITHVLNNQLIKGQKLRFECRQRGHFLRGNASVECLANGQWSHPFPTCGPSLGCGRPPLLADGDTKKSVQFQYRHNEKVEYVCQNYYKMEGEPFKTCRNGEWIGDMRCLKPCTVDKAAMSSHNIVFGYRNDDKLYSEHNDHITFTCISGTKHDRAVGMRQRCVDGVMALPTCH